MNPQMAHALKVVGISMAIAALGALLQHLNDLPLDPQYTWVLILLGAIIPAIVRVLEGAQDAERARTFDVLPRDVGYNQLQAALGKPDRVKL